MPAFLTSTSAPSARERLAALVVGCILPMAAVAAFFVLGFYDREHKQLTVDAISRARAMTSIVDRDIASTQATLLALGTSTALANGDLASFHQRAVEALRNMNADSIVLLDLSGQLLLSTRRPFGEPLPKIPSTPLLKRILATGEPGVSDLFFGPLSGGLIFTIAAPVSVGGVIRYSLNATVLPGQMSTILTEQKLPDSWRASIVDSNGGIVARTHDAAKFVGTKGNADLLRRLTVANEDSFESTSLDGIPVNTVFSRSATTKWAVALGMPLQEMQAGLQRTLVWLIVACLAALTAGLLLAWFLGGRIASSITALIQPALALGKGHVLPVPKLFFSEANQLRKALLDAGATLQGAEEAVIQAGALQSAIFNGANFSMIATDAHGVIQIFNIGAERMLGYAAVDVRGKLTPADISVPAELIERAAALGVEMQAAIAPGFEALAYKASRGIDDMYELTYLRKDGSPFPAIVSVTALRDGREGIIGYLLILTDNALRKQAEAALRENEALLRTIRLHSIVTVANRTGHMVDVNDGFCKISGYSREELLGQTYHIVSSGVHPAQFWAHMWRNIAGGKPWRGEICNRAKDGSLYWVDSMIAPLKGEDGRSDKYMSIRTDITQRKHYEQSLREGTLKAEQANQAKSEFLANMSHEIRTPMNAVIGLTYLLGQTQLDEEQGVLLSNVQFASKTLLGVLNNVLDLSKIEAGELIMERAVFSVRGLLQDVTEMTALQADAKGITFEIDTEADLPAALEGDATRLIQVLTNLLSNAIKFTERGGVTLRVRRLAPRLDGVTLSFTVQDTGIGIAPGVQEKLFAPFAQADVSITRRFGGTGLGLSIVKRLVDLMAGEVRLLSTPGVGSEFMVVLDFAPASPAALADLDAAPAAAGQQALLGVRVLVVDDSDINLQVTRRILELEGAQVRLASNGLEAVELLRAEPDAADVVLMDVQMPVLNGHDATRRIRLELGLVKLPVIALTAGALSSERQRATAAGMDDYIVKPFGPRALVASILRRIKPAASLPPIDHAAELTAQTGVPWPAIEGIDTGDVRERLAGDRELFRSMLMRLLSEFTDVACPSVAQGPAALALHASRMHKLRGSAGTLGAKAIQKLAGDAEAAAVAGQVERATDLATTLAVSIQKLHDSALSAFDDMPMESSYDTWPDDRALDPKSVIDLITLLRRQSLSAIERFHSLSGPLRRHLGPDSFRQLRDQVNELQFAEAADALAANQAAAATA